MKPITLVQTTLLLIAAGLAPIAALAQTSKPTLKAELLPSRTAAAPGETIALAVKLDIEDNWHIYHPLVLETGLPTEAKFTLPDGAAVGEIRYPAPYYREISGIAYLGYEDEAVLLTELMLADSVETGSSLPIEVEVSALICEDTGTCIPVTAKAQLNLPVAEALGAPANEDTFKSASRALVQKLNDANYLENDSQVITRHERVPVGGKSEIALVVELEPGYHIWHRDPGGVEGLIPTRVYIETPSGFDMPADERSWSTPETKTMEYLGEVNQHRDRLVVRQPFEITDKLFEPGAQKLRVLVEYQACNDDGQCFPPVTAQGFATFDVVAADEPAVANATTLASNVFGPTDEPTASDSPTATATTSIGFVRLLNILGLAFLGGLILNIMPCVLPVVSLKIFGFVSQAGEQRGRIFALGLTYGAGILASFLVIAAIMIGPQLATDGGGELRNWGALLQNTNFLLILCGVLVFFGLSMLGVFEITLPGAATSAAGAAASKEGFGGAFFNGLLTTALATPCVGPFLGPALGLMLTLPIPLQLLSIMTIGVGLAFPYVLLTAFPAWLKFMPKPGNWMVVFKQAVGFVILAVPIWLLAVVGKQAGIDMVIGALVFLFAIGFAAWLLGQTGHGPVGRAATTWIIAIALVGGGWYFGTGLGVKDPDAIQWQQWAPGKAEQLAAEGYTVYVDYTADWCLTCKANLYGVLETDAVRSTLRDLNVYPIYADFTSFDEQMQAEIQKHGRNGVPLNVIFPAGKPDEPIVLPEILTQGLVKEQLAAAGASARAPQLLAPANTKVAMN